MTTRRVSSKELVWEYGHMEERRCDEKTVCKPDQAFYECGFGREGRPIWMVHFKPDWVKTSGSPLTQRMPTKEIEVEEFIYYRGETIEVLRFLSEELEVVHRVTYRNGQLIEGEAYWEDQGYVCDRYFYEKNRLASEQSITEQGTISQETVYGLNGEETVYRVRRDGTKMEVGAPLPKGITVKKLVETIQQRLLVLIPEIVAECKLKETVYCVGIIYDDEGNDALPPDIAIGLESERSRWLKEHGKAARDFLWNPAEFKHYPVGVGKLAEDEKLAEACGYLNTHLSDTGSITPAAKLLIEVATELNSMEWPKALKRTEDFIVYAVDLEGGSLRKNLKKIVTPERFAGLKKMGWL